ncbi:uncharacterized protein LOC121974587 [Zingiber officinale]|uniref:uncharacterized protein LOC121974587 n=1 Tax=Zingiber officinale TaxID=94328 RepID=UPI001C4B5599|nr:uncharacterized protein LOC121974587 [Zingiber officinale]XP_042381667.1 uncharacterized protein LOC121974587 [Zingiber officinale]XP_042381675.1 uncharacterized protein LOC121974587 [Zingiber officinale]XP_042381682.1 uncharacterized protein LOC121974587 [Zingiber officinale]
MASSSKRSGRPVLPFRRSVSPAGGFASSSASLSAPFLHHRSASPTRVHLAGAGSSGSSSVRFSLNRSASPGRSIAASDSRSSPAPARRTCLCSPSTHPGSFRCHLHKGLNGGGSAAASSPSNRLNARRSAMANSLVRIGAVEGEWVKRALSALIRPSSHQQRRRGAFQPRPSRLSRMSNAADPKSPSSDPPI